MAVTVQRSGRTNGFAVVHPTESYAPGTAYRSPHHRRPHGPAATLARGLGWFSLALGAGGAIMPQRMARLIGVQPDAWNSGVLRFVGVRELVQGSGLLAQANPTGWVWSRVAGDTVDMAFMGSRLLTGDAKKRNRTLIALAAVAGIAVVDLVCSVLLSRHSTSGDGMPEESGMHVKKSITVWRTPDEVYHYWRNFSNFPTFMRHVESIQVTGDRRSRWRVEGPAGKSVEWDAEITEDRPGEIIAWRSLAGAEVETSGQVRFRPGPASQGTVVDVEMRYDPPGGKIGSVFARLFGKDASQQVHGDLRRFKQVMETGDVVISSGSQETTRFPQHPARP